MNTNKKLKDYLDKRPGIQSKPFQIILKEESFKNDPVLDIPDDKLSEVELQSRKVLDLMKSWNPEELIKNIENLQKEKYGF